MTSLFVHGCVQLKSSTTSYILPNQRKNLQYCNQKKKQFSIRISTCSIFFRACLLSHYNLLLWTTKGFYVNDLHYSHTVAFNSILSFICCMNENCIVEPAICHWDTLCWKTQFNILWFTRSSYSSVVGSPERHCTPYSKMAANKLFFCLKVKYFRVKCNLT